MILHFQQLFHYQTFLLPDQAVITLTGDYYIITCNIVCQCYFVKFGSARCNGVELFKSGCFVILLLRRSNVIVLVTLNLQWLFNQIAE